MLGTLTANSKFSSCAGSRGEPGRIPAARSCLPSQRGVGCLRTGTIPEELEAHSLPVSRSLSPSLVSVTAGVLEQDALTTWCRRRRRPEHLDRGLCIAANSLAPSCKQSRRQDRWQMTREHRKAFPQALGQAPGEGGRGWPRAVPPASAKPCHPCVAGSHFVPFGITAQSAEAPWP